MRFRSLVVSWCVCAIHGSVQIASGHRSLDETSRSTYHPSGDIKTLLIHSPRNIPNLPSSVLLLPVSRPHFQSRYAVDAKLAGAGVDEKTGHRKSVNPTTRETADREKIVETFAKRGSRPRRKRRKKCSCRKRDDWKKVGSSLLRYEARIKFVKSSILKSLFIPVGTTNVLASTLLNNLNPTSESTTPQRFADIAFTTTDAIPPAVNAMTITDAAKIATKKADNLPSGTYRRNLSRNRCKKIKCMTKTCKKKIKEKLNVIDVFAQEFLRDDHENATLHEHDPSPLENEDLRAIVG